MLDMVLRGGRVVTPEQVSELDIGVRDGRIVALAEPGGIAEEARRVLDVRGKIVVPGGVEPHAHPEARVAVSDERTQSIPDTTRAAAFGGTTTIVDFAWALGGRLPLEAVQRRLRWWEGRSYIDYSLHCSLCGEVSPQALAQIPEVMALGITSFKCFTTMGLPLHDPPFKVDAGYLAAVMEEVARHGGMMAIHAEDDDVVNYEIKRLQREGRDQASNLHLIHNKLSEDLSFRRVIRLAEHTGAAVYFVHVTAEEGVWAIAEARASGLPVYGEALHHYLFFTSDKYQEPEGLIYHTYPALKGPEDRDALREGVLDGTISTVATDDLTTSKAVKLAGKTVTDAVGGHNGVETRLPVVYSEFVAKGLMSLQRFVEVTSANAAKILGMYPRKGAIAVGSDADIAVIDPEVRRTIRAEEMHGSSDYTLWEGWECQGYPVMTILRGKVIVEDGELKGSEGDGRLVPREQSWEVLAGPAC